MDFFDLHCDTPYRCYEENILFDDKRLAVTPCKTGSFDRWYQCFAVFVKENVPTPFEYYRNVLKSFKEQLKQKSDNLNPVFTVEGGTVIEDDIERVGLLKLDGISAIALTWNGENLIAGGAYTEKGLTDFGKCVIEKLNFHGIATDLSHLNKKSFYDVAEYAKYPVVTHSCLESICVHRRNISDEQLKIIAEKNGLFGLCFYPEFLGDGDVYDNIYKNIHRMLDLGYENIIGIGSDFDGAVMSNGLNDISDVPNVFRYLKSRGISINILNKIFFENAYNFFKKIRGS